jgi:hypothetical protein
MITLNVLHASGVVEAFPAPTTASIVVRHRDAEDRFVIDLAKVADAASAVGNG